MLWLLQAVMTPERENTLRSALATSMMGAERAGYRNAEQ